MHPVRRSDVPQHSVLVAVVLKGPLLAGGLRMALVVNGEEMGAVVVTHQAAAAAAVGR